MGMPAAKGLFHRAIAMSGSAVRSTPADQATKSAEEFLGNLGLKANQVDQLQKLPVAQLLEATRSMQRFQLGPVVDGRTLPAHVFDPTASEISANVPLMIGSTETEVTWNNAVKFDPLDDAALHHRIRDNMKIDDGAADRLIAVYRKAPGQQSRPVFYHVHGCFQLQDWHRHGSRAQGPAGESSGLQVLLPMVFAGAGG
jgi:para-nitrobenzyl esterase